ATDAGVAPAAEVSREAVSTPVTPTVSTIAHLPRPSTDSAVRALTLRRDTGSLDPTVIPSTFFLKDIEVDDRTITPRSDRCQMLAGVSEGQSSSRWPKTT